MKVFKSYTEAINMILPRKSDLDILGKMLIEHYRKRLTSDRTTGNQLAKSTIESKRKRGAASPKTKLYEGGGLIRQIKKVVEESQLAVGYVNEAHEKMWPDDADIKIAKLVNIHHNNKKNPRQFLYIDTEEQEIIRKWLRNTLRRRTA